MKQFYSVVFCLLLLWVPTQAQEAPPLIGPGGERVEQFKKLRLMEGLKLDEESSIRFFARYNKHQEEVRFINEKRNQVIDQIEILSLGNPTDTELDKLFKELTILDSKITESRSKYYGELKEILTPKQLARYIAFERNFYRDLRQILRNIQKERFGGQRR